MQQVQRLSLGGDRLLHGLIRLGGRDHRRIDDIVFFICLLGTRRSRDDHVEFRHKNDDLAVCASCGVISIMLIRPVERIVSLTFINFVNADRHPAPFFRENLLSVPLTHIQEQITHLQHVLRRAGHAVAARTNSLGAEIPREMLHAKLAESAFKQQLQTGLARRLLHHRRNRVGVAAGILIMRTRFIRHRLGKERFQPAGLQRTPLAAANHAAISAVHRNQIAQRHLLQIFTRIFRRKLGEHVNQPIIQAQISVRHSHACRSVCKQLGQRMNNMRRIRAVGIPKSFKNHFIIDRHQQAVHFDSRLFKLVKHIV